MKESNGKLNIRVLLAVVVVGIILSQHPAFFQGLSGITPVDIPGIRAGAEKAKITGTAVWWYGPWIHEATPSLFRPLPSYVHVEQIELIDAGYSWIVTLVSVLSFAALSVCAGCLAYLVTKRADCAYMTALCTSVFRAQSDGAWLSYFPFMDNIMALTFQLVALCCFARFAKQGNNWLIVGMWVSFVVAALCKEMAYTTPFLCFALSLLLLKERFVKLALAHAMFLTAGTLMIHKYASAVTHGRIKVSLLPENFWLSVLRSGDVWLLLLLASFVLTIYCALKYSNRLQTISARAQLGAMFTFGVIIAIAIAPRGDLPFGQYALVYLVDNADVIFAHTVKAAVFMASLWAFLKYRPPVAVLACVLYLAHYPYQISGMAMVEGRAIFIIPFISLLACYCITEGLENARRLLPNTHKWRSGNIGNLGVAQNTTPNT